jgi:hypothetical protein
MAPAPHQAGTDQLQSVAEDFGTGYHHSPPSGIEAALRDPDVIIGSERMRTAKSIVGAFAILVAGAASTAAQETAGGAAPYTDSGTFLVRRGADTIATEEFSRRGVELQGRLLFKAHKFLSERYRAVVAPDAVQRARTLNKSGAEVPFFNLSGTDRQSGQTVRGTVTFLGTDSVAVGIGTVEFRLLVDPEGRLLGGGIPAQNLVIERTARGI